MTDGRVRDMAQWQNIQLAYLRLKKKNNEGDFYIFLHRTSFWCFWPLVGPASLPYAYRSLLHTPVMFRVTVVCTKNTCIAFEDFPQSFREVWRSQGLGAHPVCPLPLLADIDPVVLVTVLDHNHLESGSEGQKNKDEMEEQMTSDLCGSRQHESAHLVSRGPAARWTPEVLRMMGTVRVRGFCFLQLDTNYGHQGGGNLN